MLNAIERTRKPKRLAVNKLDRLGRDASDVMQTVKRLDAVGCSVKVLQLGDIDLTLPPGKLILATLAAVAEIERDILIERTQAGLQRAKAEGVRLGRPRTASWDSADAIRAALAEGASVSQVARDYKLPGGELRLRGARPAGTIDGFIGRHAGKVKQPLTIEEMNEIAASGWAGDA